MNGWGKNPLWFIPILFLCEVLHYFIIRGKLYQKVISIIPLICILLWKTHYNGWLPYSVSELTWFYLCFLTGYIMSPYINNIINRKLVFVIAILVIHSLLLFGLILPYNENYRQQDDDIISYIMRYGIGMIGTIGLQALSQYFSNHKIDIGLKWLGRNTLVILCTHKMYFDILRTIDHKYFSGG